MTADLQAHFDGAADQLQPGPAPVAAIRSVGHRNQRRRRMTTYAAAVGVVAAVAVVTQLARTTEPRAALPVAPERTCLSGAYIVGSDIVALDADCVAVSVATDVGQDAQAVLSPDGTSVAWTPDDGYATTLRVFDLATGTSATVAAGRRDQDIRDPAWSPDSRRIAYASDGIHLVDLSDNTDRRVASQGGSAIEPAWSRDGQRIAFLRFGIDSAWIDILDLRTEREREQPGTDAIGRGGPPVFSPDGTFLASYSSGYEHALEIRRADTGARNAAASVAAGSIVWDALGLRVVSEANADRRVVVRSYDADLTLTGTSSFGVPEVLTPLVGADATQADLDGVWSMRFSGVERAHLPALAEFDVRISISGTRASYNDGCNDIGTGLTVVDGAVEVGTSSSTLVACGGRDPVTGEVVPLPDPAGLLGQVRHAYVDGDRVLLSGITGQVLLTLTRAH